MIDIEPDLAERFRLALRGMGSSVSIVSTEVDAVRYGMVATAAMSVSMMPPSMVIAINKSASIHDRLIDRGAFAINILSEMGHSVARGFSSASGEARFANGPWLSHKLLSHDRKPLPYLANASATIFCSVMQVHAAGSHSLLVGEVHHVLSNDDRAPLLYCDGSYGSFSPIPFKTTDLKAVSQR